MLYDDVEEPGETSPDRLRDEYVAELAAVVESQGVDAVADESGVDRETVAAIAAGDADPEDDAAPEGDADPGAIQLSDAAAILAADPDAPASEDVLLEIRDHLLMGMTTAVLDVDTLAAELDDLDAKQVQQKIEGRTPMSLDEYATIHHAIASRKNR